MVGLGNSVPVGLRVYSTASRDKRTMILRRHTRPEPDVAMLLDRMRLRLPEQPPPRITAAQATPAAVVKTSRLLVLICNDLQTLPQPIR